MQSLNPDFPPSPSFSFYLSTCDFSYSFNKHLLRTYDVPVTADTEGPQSSGGGRTNRNTNPSTAWLCPLRGQSPTVSGIGAPQTSCVTQESEFTSLSLSVSCKMGMTLVQIIIIVTTATIIIIPTSSRKAEAEPRLQSGRLPPIPEEEREHHCPGPVCRFSRNSFVS